MKRCDAFFSRCFFFLHAQKYFFLLCNFLLFFLIVFCCCCFYHYYYYCYFRLLLAQRTWSHSTFLHHLGKFSWSSHLMYWTINNTNLLSLWVCMRVCVRAFFVWHVCDRKKKIEGSRGRRTSTLYLDHFTYRFFCTAGDFNFCSKWEQEQACLDPQYLDLDAMLSPNEFRPTIGPSMWANWLNNNNNKKKTDFPLKIATITTITSNI